MAEEIIGKVSATDKNPSTINEFYFWTKAGYKLSPFDVIKVDHIEDSVISPAIYRLTLVM